LPRRNRCVRRVAGQPHVRHGTVLLSLYVSRENGRGSLQKNFNAGELRYVRNLPGGRRQRASAAATSELTSGLHFGYSGFRQCIGADIGRGRSGEQHGPPWHELVQRAPALPASPVTQQPFPFTLDDEHGLAGLDSRWCVSFSARRRAFHHPTRRVGRRRGSCIQLSGGLGKRSFAQGAGMAPVRQFRTSTPGRPLVGLSDKDSSAAASR
jgi:hypothetical protein